MRDLVEKATALRKDWIIPYPIRPLQDDDNREVVKVKLKNKPLDTSMPDSPLMLADKLPLVRGTVVPGNRLYRLLRAFHRELLARAIGILSEPDITEAAAKERLEAEAKLLFGGLADELEPHLRDLFERSLRQGIVLANGGFVEPADINAMRFLAEKEGGAVPSIQSFMEEQRRVVEDLISQAFSGQVPFDLNVMTKWLRERVSTEDWKLRRIIRTETSKVANLGMIMAWEEDPLKDQYDYWWVATFDARTKEISKERDRGSPYTFDQIKQLVLDQGEDAFNQRCVVSRTRKI